VSSRCLTSIQNAVNTLGSPRVKICCLMKKKIYITTGYGLTVRGSNPDRGKIFRTCPDRPWGPPTLLYSGYRVIPGGKERPGRDADPSPFLVPWSRKSRAIPLLTTWAVGPVQSLSVCTTLHFTLYIYIVIMGSVHCLELRK